MDQVEADQICHPTENVLTIFSNSFTESSTVQRWDYFSPVAEPPNYMVGILKAFFSNWMIPSIFITEPYEKFKEGW